MKDKKLKLTSCYTVLKLGLKELLYVSITWSLFCIRYHPISLFYITVNLGFWTFVSLRNLKLRANFLYIFRVRVRRTYTGNIVGTLLVNHQWYWWDEVKCMDSRQPADWIIVINQSHTNHSYSQLKADHFNMAPSSLNSSNSKDATCCCCCCCCISCQPPFYFWSFSIKSQD